MRRIAKASPAGGGWLVVAGEVGLGVGAVVTDCAGAVAPVAGGEVGWVPANRRSSESTVAAWARLAVIPTTPSCQTTKSSRTTPAVIASSPTTPTTDRIALTDRSQPPVTRSRSMDPVYAGKSPDSLVATS